MAGAKGDDGPEPVVPTYPDVTPEPEPKLPEPVTGTYPDVEPEPEPKAPKPEPESKKAA